MRPPSITTAAWMSPWRHVPQPVYVPSFHCAAGAAAGADGAGAAGGVTDATETVAGAATGTLGATDGVGAVAVLPESAGCSEAGGADGAVDGSTVALDGEGALSSEAVCTGALRSLGVDADSVEGADAMGARATDCSSAAEGAGPLPSCAAERRPADSASN
jgi:hypothetical protein